MNPRLSLYAIGVLAVCTVATVLIVRQAHLLCGVTL